VEVVKLQVTITSARVEGGQRAARVAFALVSVMPQIIKRSGIWVVIDAILEIKKSYILRDLRRKKVTNILTDLICLKECLNVRSLMRTELHFMVASM